MHVPPPDFRWVGVEPGPSLRRVRKTVLIASASVFFAGLLVARRVDWVTIGLAGLAALFAAIVALRAFGPLPRAPSRMSIVPWGVLVHHEQTPRILRWPAVREVRVDLVHDMDHATPSTRWSLVTIRTEQETFGGRAAGDVGLERLEAHLERYAAEAARPVALDLEGQEAAEDFLEPVFERVLHHAQRLLGSGELGRRLSLPPRSYRSSRPETDPETRCELERVLESGSEAPADPRPLALVLAAELGASDLLDRMLPLTASPNPVIAAVARAAAQRLGADVRSTGALEEIDEFLPEMELAHIRRWAAGA